jgi:hypothetical protein
VVDETQNAVHILPGYACGINSGCDRVGSRINSTPGRA